MRVGIFSNAYRPVLSGVVNSIDLIRKELLRQGHRPFLFTPATPARHAGIFRYPSLNLSRQIYYPIPIPLSCRNAAVLRKLRLDVVHTHHPFLLSQVAVSTARQKRIPLVYTFHTQYEQYAHYIPLPAALTRWIGREAVRAFCRQCQLVVAPSPNITALLEEYRVSTWTVTLPNAIDLSRFRPSPRRAQLRAELGYSAEDRVALYAGRLGKEKNLDFLLRAFAGVEGPGRKLLVVGEGPERARLAAQFPSVRFPGSVPYERMPEYFAAADFFAMASVTEVKPLAVLEAMAAGLPVIAVSACGTADTVTHERDGLLGPHDAQAFQALLERAYRADLADWGQQALATSAQYGIENYTRRLVELYEEAARRLRGTFR